LRLGLLGAVGFLTAFGAHVVVVGLPAYGRARGLGYEALGFLLASYNLAEILAKPLMGRMIDRIGPRPVMLWGTAFFAFSCLAYLVMPPAALMGLRVCQGAGAGALSVSSLVLVAKGFPDRLGRAFGTYNALKGTGYVCAPLVGGLFSKWAGFRGAFLVAGLAGLAVLALLARADFSPGIKPGRADGARDPAVRLWPWYLANFADMSLLGILLGFLPVRADGLGYDGRAIGLLLTGATLAYLAAQPISGALADRIGRRPLVLFGLALGGMSTIALGSLAGPFLPAAAVLGGFGLGATWTNSLAHVGEAAGKGRVGSDLGLAGSCKDAGDIAGPLTLGYLAERFGLGRAFGLWGLVGILIAVLVGLGSKAKG